MDSQNANSGAYQIIIRLKKKKLIQIGKLGSFEFDEGLYVYTGSAMRYLKQRVARHCRKEKILKWHIDYFTADCDTEIIETRLFPSYTKEECEINMNQLDSGRAIAIVNGFGSSDCKICPAHLLKIIE